MKNIFFILLLIPFSGISQTITWDFNSTNDGWSTTGFTEIAGTDALQLTSTATNPKIAISGQDIRTGDLAYYYAAITLRIAGDGPTLVRFGYAKNTSPTNFSYVNRPIANNTPGFVSYYIDLDAWSGRISDLSIEFKNNDGSVSGADFTNNGAVIEIDKIKIFDGDPDDPDSEPRKTTFDFNLDYDTDQWEGLNATTQGPTGGILTFQPQSGVASKLVTTSTFYVIPTSGSNRKYLNITLKNENSDIDEIRVQAEFSSVSAIKAITTSDSGFKTYSIDLSVLPNWNALVTIVDISFVNSSTQLSSASGNILIDEISFTTNALSSDEFIRNDANVSLFPNPVTTFLSFDSKTPISNIEIYDYTGKLILKQLGSHTINVQNLANGIYITKIFGDNTFAIKKFIKK